MKIRVLFILLTLGFGLGCTKNSTSINSDNIGGVWKNVDENPPYTINGKWIPNNLHIADTEKENIIRVRILDPIACTDAYPELRNHKVNFSKYELDLNILFLTNNTAELTVTDGDSSLKFRFYKTDRQPYWGLCD